MLYPPVVELFPKGSNLRAFADRFTLVQAFEDKDNQDFWRIFNFPWSKELRPEDIPEDTSLRRALKAYLMAGNCMGTAGCVLWVE